MMMGTLLLTPRSVNLAPFLVHLASMEDTFVHASPDGVGISIHTGEVCNASIFLDR